MRALTLEEQRRRICARFAGAKTSFIEGRGQRCLKVELQLRPTDTSPFYRVGLLCLLRYRPLVCVLDPAPVRHLDGVPTPHLNRDLTLCLFDAVAREWTPGDYIADTTIPWTLRWLFHYEHWVVFREWLGDVPDAAPSKLIPSGEAVGKDVA